MLFMLMTKFIGLRMCLVSCACDALIARHTCRAYYRNSAHRTYGAHITGRMMTSPRTLSELCVHNNPLRTVGFTRNGDLAAYDASPGGPRRLLSVSAL